MADVIHSEASKASPAGSGSWLETYLQDHPGLAKVVQAIGLGLSENPFQVPDMPDKHLAVRSGWNNDGSAMDEAYDPKNVCAYALPGKNDCPSWLPKPEDLWH